MLNVKKIDLIDDEKDLRDIMYRIVMSGDRDVGKTYEWIISVVDAHLGKDSNFTLRISNLQGQPVAILPLYIDNIKRKGLKVKTIKPISSIYSTHGGLVIENAEENALLSAFKYIYFHEKWDMFEIILQQNFKIEGLLRNLALQFNFGVLAKNYESSPYLVLKGNVNDFLKAKSKNFRSNLKRKEKKLKIAGDVTLQIYTKPKEVKIALKELIAIENRSWKYRKGSAITSKKSVEKFYSLLAKNCASANWLRIYILKLEGTPIAFDFGLLFEKKYSMLKTSYDEKYKDFSPGVVLRWYVIKDLFENECEEHDFLWGEETYKLEWCSDIRKHKIFYFYNRRIIPKILYYIDKTSQYFKSTIDTAS